MILAQQNEEADDIEFDATNEEEELRKKLALSGLKMYGNKDGDAKTQPTSQEPSDADWEDVPESKKEK